MRAQDTAIHDAQTALRAKGLRVTNARVQLLLLLRNVGKPLSIQEILQRWEEAPNQATVYRILNDLSTVDIIERVSTLSGVAHFEYTPDKPHHHHIVCTSCGMMEDITHCFAQSIQKKVVLDAQNFTHINSHTLEFFGRCTKCVQPHNSL